jgi:uncharacterized membrane protein
MSATSLPAVTALGGTVVGLVVGELRARRTDRREDGEFYRDRRRAAYEQLWKITEDVLGTARVRDDLDAAEHLDLTRRVNVFSLQHAVYIDAPDRQRAGECLESVLVFLTCARVASGQSAVSADDAGHDGVPSGLWNHGPRAGGRVRRHA